MKPQIDLTKHEIDPDDFWSAVHKSDGCWEWTKGINTTGYGIYMLTLPVKVRNETGKRHIGLSAHRVAFYLENGAINNDLLVCHTCDNRKCCNPSHLFQGTYQDNMDDMKTKLASGNKRKHVNLQRSYENRVVYRGIKIEFPDTQILMKPTKKERT